VERGQKLALRARHELRLVLGADLNDRDLAEPSVEEGLDLGDVLVEVGTARKAFCDLLGWRRTAGFSP
jgi:hypothetical protein